MALIYIICVKLNLLPSSGMYSSVGSRPLGDLLTHLVLPACTVAIGQVGTQVRYVRAAVLEELGKDYLRTAKAKGVPPTGRIVRHALRNSLLSIITLIAMQVPNLFGGSVIVETIFSWPGIGSLMSASITARDYPVLMAMILISALVVVVVNLVTDLMYALIDPRIRLK
ncbi:MAG: ABC transporter permease, partial [Oscillospiraceae bacterium]|nr:ABC transporter permease [Oscillospiraceae bacterium]